MNSYKMNRYDAAKILNISGDLTPETVKAAYHAAAMANHPDRVGDASTHMMQMINKAYDSLKDFSGSVEYTKGADYGSEVSEAIQAIVHFDRLDIEVCGSWVWVSGTSREKTDEMKAIRAALKGAGFRYHGKKAKWYKAPSSDLKRKARRSNVDMEQIRATYGSEKVETRSRQKLAS